MNDMDAQDAAQSDQTKSADRPVSPAPAGDQPEDSSRQSPTKPARDASPQPERFAWAGGDDDDDSSDDADSNAETVVLPGKDGHSPSKARKVRQEDNSDGDGDAVSRSDRPSRPPSPADKTGQASGGDKSVTADRPASSAGTAAPPKKKRIISASDESQRGPRNKDASSGLSSAPGSPSRHHPRRRSEDGSRSSPSDSERSQHQSSSKSSLRDKIRPTERLVPPKRKAPKTESDDEAEARKARRQRTNSTGLEGPRSSKEARATPAKEKSESRNHSHSPPLRSHRRSASRQLANQSSNGLAQKKKRIPPPLQPTDYISDDSSASGSPHPRSTKLRSLAGPASGADANISPAKMGPHKKHLDAHGQTLLARACARGEYDVAKQRLRERPEDLNVADYAGNTPLQIAAINGCEDIVQLLIEAGCNLDCVNYDKDTPLLDAVDNGHLGVVNLLLDAGVNPRKANVNGEEPIDRVTEETDNADEIRDALLNAKKRAGERRRTSEERHSHSEFHDARESHAPDSPRRSPPPGSLASGRRSGTVRATKTRNDLLYMNLDEKTLRQAAGRGDEETVARILQVKEGVDDPESMVAAARGGHDLVIQLLLGLGGANPDPAAVPSLQSEFATPILAAIGQENIKVLELLLEQQGFDPTRRFKGETYYEIARRRQGTNWKEEEHILKNAYDEYKRTRRDTVKGKSPKQRDEKRSRRDDAREVSKAKRSAASPSRDMDSRKKLSSSKVSSPKEKRRSGSFGDDGAQRKASKSKRDKTPSVHPSDREISPTLSHKAPKVKRAESDAAAFSSDGEAVKPRRKLVSKGVLRGEREKQRRASIVSNASSLKEPSSPHDSRNDEPAEKSKPSEKYHDRTKALKRDESKDRLPHGDGAAKRHRSSITPDRPSNGEHDDEAQPKRRRIDGNGQEKRQKRPASSDGHSAKASAARDGSSKTTRHGGKDREEDGKSAVSYADRHRRESGKSSASERSIHVKSEDVDVEMADVHPAAKSSAETDARTAREAEEADAKKKLLKEEEAKQQQANQQAEAEARQKRQMEVAKAKLEADAKRKEEEEIAAQKKREEDAARVKQEEADRQRREAEEAVRREEEEKRRLEEEKRRKEKEEEERKQREEEERLHQEQLEREAAEAARRKKEEEERREAERKERERLHREDMERKRAAREAEQRRIREEQERARLDKLPPLLRWLDTCPNPKTPFVADLFKRIQGVRYDTIRPQYNQTPEGREQWVLNTHAALLLGEKDLGLSRYTGWERVPASHLAKLTLWRVEWQLYSLVSRKLWDLGRQVPECYDGKDPGDLRFDTKEKLRVAAWERFRKTDLFFVKLSDLLYTVTNIAHLRDVKLDVEYRELLESESQAIGWKTPQKWKQDPDADRYHGFAPRHKYYVNGTMVGEEIPSLAQVSKTPFPEQRVPRRGLVRVFPDDPDYVRLCLEQGLEHLTRTNLTPSLSNGVYSSPTSQTSATPALSMSNGTNGHGMYERGHEHGANGQMLNGFHGTST